MGAVMGAGTGNCRFRIVLVPGEFRSAPGVAESCYFNILLCLCLKSLVLLKRGSIGDGAVVGTGALVTKDIPPYSINVGVPAKTIRYRLTEEQIKKLLAEKWWEKDEKWLRDNIERFGDIETFLDS